MEKIPPDFIGKITIKSLGDLIIRRDLTIRDTIYISERNFDDIVLEYRDTYKNPLQKPFKIFDVVVEEDSNKVIKNGEVGIQYNVRSRSIVYEPVDESPEDGIVYRCGWCGNVVDYDGSELDPNIRSKYIHILQTDSRVNTVSVSGYCCRNKH